MAEKVSLEIARDSSWRSPNRKFDSTPVRAALPFWRSRRGFLIHRARSMVIFFNDRGRIAVHWWCGNQSHNPIPYRPECSEGLQWCKRCAANWDARARR